MQAIAVRLEECLFCTVSRPVRELLSGGEIEGYMRRHELGTMNCIVWKL